MRKRAGKQILPCLWVVLLGVWISTAAAGQSAPPVTVTDDGEAFTLANGILTARVAKRSGNLVSLTYKGIETLAARGGGYWSHTPASVATVDTITITPSSTGGERGEVSIKGSCGGRPMGSGPGGSVVADIEIRYALARGSSGLWTYTILDHKADYPYTSLGEARYAAKLNDSVFDWMTVDARRNMKMITASDWNHGVVMNMKEARLMTTGIMKGQVEHKYDYSAVQFDTPALGWSSTTRHIGFWIVNPSMEYLSGGPTKLELSAHRDATFNVGPQYYDAPAAPTVLNYWRGSHYGGSSVVVGEGEAWTKVVGPFLLYCNSGASPTAMWKDALAQAATQARAWPYDWVAGVDYPHRNQRATVSGQIVLSDPQALGTPMTNLLVGLAHPDYAAPAGGLRRPGGSGSRAIDWQMDAKYYQFWVHADAQGRFTIPSVRPGAYTLHAIAGTVLGEYTKANVTVTAGQSLNLGRLTWRPLRYGRQLWDIGVPDRTAGEFRHGDHYWQWGLYLQYPKDFPTDVNYVVGKSDYHRDWNLMQVPRADPADTIGRSAGTAATWSVTFNMPKAAHGRATLRLAFAGTEARSLALTMNDQPIATLTGFLNNSAIHRDSDRGYWAERDVAFDGALLKAGANVLKLTVPAGSVMSGVEYDYLRLELDETAVP